MKIDFIDSDKKLSSCLSLLEGRNIKTVGLDTEFISASTYYPVLSTVQISFFLEQDINCLVVDVKTIGDISSLLGYLARDDIVKILYAARVDILILNNLCKKNITNVIDLQLAANFANYKLDISYRDIVSKNFDVVLDKSVHYSSWKRRPLLERNIKYAALDVFFLLNLWKMLKEDLVLLGRLDWFLESNNYFISKISSVEAIVEKNLVSFLSVDLRLNQSLLYNVLHLRELLAIEKNILRKSVIKDKDVIFLIRSYKDACDFFISRLFLSRNYVEEFLLRDDYRKNFCYVEKNNSIYMFYRIIMDLICKKNDIYYDLLVYGLDVTYIANGYFDESTIFQLNWKKKIAKRIIDDYSNGKAKLKILNKKVSLCS